MDDSRRGPAHSSSQQTSPFTPPQINLPKGGGAIRGIDEKFAANPITGTGSLTVTMFTPTPGATFCRIPVISASSATWTPESKTA